MTDPGEMIDSFAPLEWISLESAQSVSAEFEDVYSVVGDELLTKPKATILALESAISANYLNIGRPKLHLINIGSDRNIAISDVREDSIGELISIDGIVRKITQVKYEMLTGVFKCNRCPAKIKILQTGQGMIGPGACYLEQDGCGRSVGKGRDNTRFSLVESESEYRNVQKFEIQEMPENLSGGDQPNKLIGYVYDDLVGHMTAGDRVTLTGWLEIDQTKEAKEKGIFDLRFIVNNIKQLNESDECNRLTEEELTEITELAKSPGHVTKLIRSIAPSIHGYEEIKEAIALQLFGGVAKQAPDGQRLRGDFHILLVGDPGIAKSQLLHFSSKLSNRGTYVSGKASTAAGLTAAAVKDEFGEGRYVLEAGALVMADKGFAAVDEMDKMSEQDRSSMHEVMESQSVTVAKAGIKATLMTRCPVLGAANPKLGRFDPTESLTSQIDMPPALLSRFDLIFALTDNINAERDAAIARHILGNHISAVPLDSKHQAITKSDLYDRDTIRKFVLHGRTIIPKIPNELIEMVVAEYVRVRKLGENDHKMSITPRQSEAYIRLSEASARMRFSESVEKEDVERAIRIVNNYLLKLLGGDVDNAVSSIPTNERQRIDTLKRILRTGERGTMNFDELLNTAVSYGINEDRVRRLIDEMTNKGIVMCPKVGWYKVID